jgi:hypothetical protein
MAFNFYGTLTTGQFNEFVNFSKYQEQDIKKRIDWLTALASQIGVFTTEYDSDNYPKSFSVAPDNSYGAKLLKVYKIMGGVPEKDMMLRTRDLPVYLLPGQPLSQDTEDLSGGTSREYSNGRLDRGTQRFDRSLGIKITKIKNWQIEAIKRKREHIEFKLKRAMDHSDQIMQEIKMLQQMVNDSSRSLDFIVADATSQMFASGTMNVVQNLEDTHGRLIGQPVDITNEQDYAESFGNGGRVEGGSADQRVSTETSNSKA